jgi:hypothetical protein
MIKLSEMDSRVFCFRVRGCPLAAYRNLLTAWQPTVTYLILSAASLPFSAVTYAGILPP